MTVLLLRFFSGAQETLASVASDLECQLSELEAAMTRLKRTSPVRGQSVDSGLPPSTSTGRHLSTGLPVFFPLQTTSDLDVVTIEMAENIAIHVKEQLSSDSACADSKTSTADLEVFALKSFSCRLEGDGGGSPALERNVIQPLADERDTFDADSLPTFCLYQAAESHRKTCVCSDSLKSDFKECRGETSTELKPESWSGAAKSSKPRRAATFNPPASRASPRTVQRRAKSCSSKFSDLICSQCGGHLTDSFLAPLPPEFFIGNDQEPLESFIEKDEEAEVFIDSEHELKKTAIMERYKGAHETEL